MLRALLPLLVLVGLLWPLALPAEASGCRPRVVVNGVEIAFDVPPLIENSRTLVPMRAIFEALGAEIYWDAETRTVSAARGQVALAIQIDNTYANVNNEPIALDVPPKIIEGRTFVPLRFISESLGADVGWDPATCTATITDQGGLADANAHDLVGFWADNINSFAQVNAVTGMPVDAGWSGEWFGFSADGTFRHTVGGCGSVVCGLAIQHGKYEIRGEMILLYARREDWTPMRSNQRPSYTDRPMDDQQLRYTFGENGNLRIVSESGFVTNLFRVQNP